jgi:DNA-binding response OmpR family regulator
MGGIGRVKRLLRALRKSASPMKIIAMSGGGRGSAFDYLGMAKALGAAAVLEKPFSQPELDAAIAFAFTP